MLASAAKRLLHLLNLIYYQLYLGPRGRGRTHLADYWEGQYRSRMDVFDSAEELTRYAMVGAYIAYYCGRSPAILDVGCGYGRLLELLGQGAVRRYVGIDRSPTAIERLRGRAGGDVAFDVADFTTWTPTERFDAIVFNEVLYYVADPVAVLRRYAAALTDDGVIIVSIFEHHNSRLIWRDIHRRFAAVAAVRLKTLAGATKGEETDVRVLRPRRRAAAAAPTRRQARPGETR